MGISKFGEYGNISRNLWIGLQETAKEGVYVWVDGSSLKYSNWLAGEPNNMLVIERYVHMIRTDNPWRHKGGGWNDLPDIGQRRDRPLMSFLVLSKLFLFRAKFFRTLAAKYSILYCLLKTRNPL